VVTGAIVGWWLYLAIPDPLANRIVSSATAVLVGVALGIVRVGELPLRGWIWLAVAYRARPRLLVTTDR
jgi:hypothetical protein